MTDVEYVSCLYCGRSFSRITKTGEERHFKWMDVDPMGWKYLQIRRGGGKRPYEPGEERRKGVGRGGNPGIGFKVVPELSKTIPEMMDDPKFRPVAEMMKARLITIVRAWIEAGYMTIEEVSP